MRKKLIFGLLLSAAAAGVLGLFSLVPGFLEPYLDEVGRASSTRSRFVLYVALLVVWAFGSELVLRGLVQRRMRHTFTALACVLYAAVHARYGAWQLGYGLVLGGVLAVFFSHAAARFCRDLVLAFVVWRLAWDFGALGVALLLGTAQVEPFFTPIARAHKVEQLASGRLFVHPEMGVLDHAHLEASEHRKKDALDVLTRGERRVHSEVFFAGAFSLVTRHVYVELKGPLPKSALEREDAACGYAFALAIVEEDTQLNAPVLSAGRLSAYSPEDVQSAAAICLVDVGARAPAREVNVAPRRSPRIPERYKARWSSISKWATRWHEVRP